MYSLVRISAFLILICIISSASSYSSPSLHHSHPSTTTTSPSSSSPSRFLNFLLLNKANTSDLPLSYRVPKDYWKSLSPEYHTNASQYVDACGRVSTGRELDEYTFQTEQLLTSAGINLYDAAVRTIALSLLNHTHTAEEYERNTLLLARTYQFANIRGSARCKGIQYYNQCVNDCGFCYGGYDVQKTGLSVDDKHAYFFRLISDIWGFEGTVDARCPEKNMMWTWNDWRPVAGENAWANFIGPLQVAYIKAAGNVNEISDDSTAMQLAVHMFYTFQKMQMPNGGIAYAPWNTWDVNNHATGGTASIENAASALAGLQALHYVILHKRESTHKNILSQLESVIFKLTEFIKSAYSKEDGYFLQGGIYDINGNFQWNSDPASKFAVDCQTWVLSVVGVRTVDEWFGEGTALNVWTVTKQIGGFYYDAYTNTARGLGFSVNHQTKVLSGEWTFGGINLLRSLAKQYPEKADFFNEEAFVMRESIEEYLTSYNTATSSDTVNYANKRYWIPFGWYANPIPSLASVSWAVLVDSYYNPFTLGGSY